MYQTSEGFKSAILGDNRKFHSKIICNGTEYVDIVKSVKISSAVCGSNYFSIGGAVSDYVELELWNPPFEVKGSEMQIHIGPEVGTGIEWCQVGVYTAQTPKKSIDGMATVTAYDVIQSKLSGAYFSKLTYPTDAINVLNEISQMTGVGISADNLESGVIINKRKVISEKDVDVNGNETENITYENPFDGYLYREALGYIAMLYCKYATSNSTGNIEFLWHKNVDYTVKPSRYYGDITTSDLFFSVNRIACSTGEEELYSGTGSTNIQLENPVMTQERLDYIYSKVKDLTFMPLSLSFFGDIRVRCCDIISIVDLNGVTFKVPIMNIGHDFDGGLKSAVSSYGGTDNQNEIKSPTLTRIERTYAEMLLIKEIVGQKASFDYVQSIDADFKNLNADYGSFKIATVGKLDALKADIEVINASNITTENLDAKLAEIGVLTANEAILKYATIESLNALSGKFDDLSAKSITTTNISAEVAKLGYATVNELDATTARVETLETDSLKTKDLSSEVAKLGYATIAELNATNATVNSLKTEKLDAETASLTYATISNLNAANANISKLQGDYASFNELTTNNFKSVNASIENLNTITLKTSELSSEVAKLGYADIKLSNIDVANISKANVAELLVEIGLIDSAVISEGHVTGYLDSVAINANNIKAGTLSVDRLVISGTDKSIIFALNNAGDLTSTSVDTLDGGLLTDRTITADKLVAKSITASEIAAGAITASEIKTGTITTANISTGAITTDKIATEAVTTEKLVANAVTAEKINVEDLFAQNITATGTITGVNLVGATGSFSGEVKAKLGEIGGITINTLGLTAYAFNGTIIKDPITGENIYGRNKNRYLEILGSEDVGNSLIDIPMLKIVNNNEILFAIYEDGECRADSINPMSDYSSIGFKSIVGGINQFGKIYGKEFYENGVLLSNKYALKGESGGSGGTVSIEPIYATVTISQNLDIGTYYGTLSHSFAELLILHKAGVPLYCKIVSLNITEILALTALNDNESSGYFVFTAFESYVRIGVVVSAQTAGGLVGVTNMVSSLSDLGISATAKEINYLAGASSNIQTQLNNKATKGHGIYYGTCDTSNTTAEKVVTLEDSTGFSLTVGTVIVVKFTNQNSATTPKLNVEGTGAIPIMLYGTTAASTGTTTSGWIAGAVQVFVYDGTNWVRDYWNNTTYSNVSLGQGYATCVTAAATVAKVATLSSYALVIGGIVAVKFTNAVPANATLNINGKGAKAIYHRGAKITAGIIEAGDTATFIYNGAYYHLLTVDKDLNNYAKKATTLSGYGITDGATKEQFDQLSEQIADFGNVLPDYWLVHLEEKMSDINNALMNSGANKSAFMFYSDAHWTSNNGMSPALLKYAMKNSGINKVFFSGDVVDYETDLDYLWEWRSSLHGLEHHSAPGNHDDGNTTDKLLTKKQVYGYLLAPEETSDIVRDNTEGLYYYIDRNAEKTRYIFLDTAAWTILYDAVQMQFLIDALSSTPEGWHIIAIAHIWYNTNYDVSPPTVGNLSYAGNLVLGIFDKYNARSSGTVSIANSSTDSTSTNIAYDFTNAKGAVELCVGGHTHWDYDGTSTDGIPVILVETDSKHVRSGLEYTTGTINENAVSGIVVDYDAKKVEVIRIGRGSSRTVALKGGGEEPEQPTNYTNQLKVATDKDGILYNGGKGYKENIRINSSQVETTATGWDTTGFISAKKGDIIRMKNVTFLDIEGTGGSSPRACIHMYSDSYEHIVSSATYSPSSLMSSAWSAVYGENGDVVQFTIPTSYSTFSKIRITAKDINDESIITVNEEII